MLLLVFASVLAPCLASFELIEAVKRDDVAEVKQLLKAGANIEHAKTKFGGTPLVYACHHGHAEIVQVLLKLGAKADHVDNHGHTPLQVASENGHSHIVNFLLDPSVKHKPNVDAADTYGQTALFLAVGAPSNDHSRYIAVIKALIDAGANVDAKTKYGVTPIMKASAKGHEHIVQVLLDAGADVTAVDKGGDSALSEAKDHALSDHLIAILEIALAKQKGEARKKEL